MRLVVALSLLVALLAPPCALAQSAPAVSYRLVHPSAGSGSVRVTMRLDVPLPLGGVLVMPRAIPMGYGAQPYDGFVSDVAATSSQGRPVEVARQEGPRWRLGPGVSAITYAVDLRRMEAEVLSAADSSKVREGYLGVLGYSVFAYVEGREDTAAQLDVEGPAGWPVFSTLAPGARTWRVTARAADFYTLADSQIVMGPAVSIAEIPNAGIPLHLLIYAEVPVDTARVARLAGTAFARVALQEVLTPVSPRHGYNFSMEHLDSMTSTMPADRALTAQSPAEDDIPAQFNFAHHIAHAWVPKRASGAGYFPFQWELAPLIDTIWFAEGFGQYAAIVAIAAGEPDPAAYRERLLERRFRQTLHEAPLFLRRLSLVELSRVASTRYSEDFRVSTLE